MEQSKSILGLILEIATERSSSAFSWDMYLFLSYVSAAKVGRAKWHQYIHDVIGDMVILSSHIVLELFL